MADSRSRVRIGVSARLPLPRPLPPEAVSVCPAPRRGIRRPAHPPPKSPRRQKAGRLGHRRQLEEVRERGPSPKRDRSHPPGRPRVRQSRELKPPRRAAPHLPAPTCPPARIPPVGTARASRRPRPQTCPAVGVLTDQEIESRLRREFKEALSRASRCKRQIFVELYAGIGSLAQAWRKMGYVRCDSF